MALANQLQDAIHSSIVTAHPAFKLPGSVANLVRGFVTPERARDYSLPQLKKLYMKTKKQTNEAFILTHKFNPYFWDAMVDPMPLAKEPESETYQYGDRHQVKIWLMPNYKLWKPAMAFIKKNRSRCGQFAPLGGMIPHYIRNQISNFKLVDRLRAEAAAAE